jgi:Uma2 family endonuclease
MCGTCGLRASREFSESDNSSTSEPQFHAAAFLLFCDRTRDRQAMSQTTTTPMTVEEFFDWQSRQDRNYELVDGVPVMTVKAMTGATDQHDRITVNAIVSLGTRLRGKPCRPKTSDTSVLTWRGTRRPDITVECGRPDPRSMAADEPRLVIEILSPSTMRFDRFQKLAEYQRHPSIAVILLVDSEKPQVAVWRRSGDIWDTVEIEGIEATVDLPEIGTALPLTELYEDVTFSER